MGLSLAKLTLASDAPSSVLTALSLLTSACRGEENVTTHQDSWHPGASGKLAAWGVQGADRNKGHHGSTAQRIWDLWNIWELGALRMTGGTWGH